MFVFTGFSITELIQSPRSTAAAAKKCHQTNRTTTTTTHAHELKMRFQLIVIHLLCIVSALYGQVLDYQPQQIHIAFGGMSIVCINIYILF